MKLKSRKFWLVIIGFVTATLFCYYGFLDGWAWAGFVLALFTGYNWISMKQNVTTNYQRVREAYIMKYGNLPPDERKDVGNS